MIDFLQNHRNWVVLYDNSAGVGSDVSIEHTVKKDKKEKHKLTDKRSK